MTRSASTALALTLTLSLAVAAAAVAVFAQGESRSAAAASPASSRPAAPASAEPGSASSDADRSSIRSGSLSITATEKTNPQTVKDGKIPEIEVDSSNVRQVQKSAITPIRESRRELKLTSTLPDSALAARITDKTAETVETWRPAFASQGFRGTRLDAFAVSDDGSVLAIAERTGSSAGPNGTRIILINTSNWQVIRTFTTDRMLKKIAFIPGQEALTAIAFPQPALKQNFGRLHFDLRTGKPGPFQQLPFPFNDPITPDKIALLAVPEAEFCSGFFGSKVFCIPYDPDESALVKYSTFETMAPALALSLTPDGKAIAAVSQKAIEYFHGAAGPGGRMDYTVLSRKSFTTLDLGWTPVSLNFLGSAQTDFILCPAYREDSPPVVIRSSIKESLDGRSAGFTIPMENNSRIGVAFKVKGRIDVINPATLEAVDSVVLEQLRPETSGDAAFVFYLDSIHAFCVIDNNGNCFAVGKIADAKRWSKRIIWNGGVKK